VIVAYKSEKFLLWLVAVGFFMETLDSTIVNTALPSMARALGESPLSMHAVVIAYSLTIALWIPASGWVADRVGIRKTFISAIIIFTIGSILCSMSQSLTQLVAARVLQGTGGSMLLPIGRLAVLRTFPRERFLDAIAFVAVPALIGPLIGPTLGGFLVDVASWHWIFLINVPVGIVGCIATMKFMPAIPSDPPDRFDVSGFIRLALGMLTLSLALEGLSELAIPHGVILLLIFTGIASICSYFLHAMRVPHPLFNLRMFKSQTFTVALLGNLFARIGAGSVPFLIPLLLQVSLGYTALQAGLIMLPVAIAGIAAKQIIARLVLKWGYQRFLMTNTLLVGISIAGFALMSHSESIYLRLIHLIFFGTVNSMQFSAMNSLALKDLDPRLASSGNSLFSMIQMLGMSLGVAAAGSLLTSLSHRFATPLHAFRATFVCMGLITCLSSLIFYYLSPRIRIVSNQQEKLPVSL